MVKCQWVKPNTWAPNSHIDTENSHRAGGKKKGTCSLCIRRWWGEPPLPGYGEGDAVKRQIGWPTAEELVPGARTPSQRFTVQLPGCRWCAVSVQKTVALAWLDGTAVKDATDKKKINWNEKTTLCHANKCLFLSTSPFYQEPFKSVQLCPWSVSEERLFRGKTTKNARTLDSLMTTTPTEGMTISPPPPQTTFPDTSTTHANQPEWLVSHLKDDMKLSLRWHHAVNKCPSNYPAGRVRHPDQE